ncbi:hypothetical protein ACIA5C_07855 [Actinoplanes sp. NPDC051343]|uniref:hypothetical protein n=1 Tax=Actinoplanes sp. NPDC051343 TaxID=3363906 RepID=UPI00378D9677
MAHCDGEFVDFARASAANHVIDRWRRPIREYATDKVPRTPLRRTTWSALSEVADILVSGAGGRRGAATGP